MNFTTIFTEYVKWVALKRADSRALTGNQLREWIGKNF